MCVCVSVCVNLLNRPKERYYRNVSVIKRLSCFLSAMTTTRASVDKDHAWIWIRNIKSGRLLYYYYYIPIIRTYSGSYKCTKDENGFCYIFLFCVLLLALLLGKTRLHTYTHTCHAGTAELNDKVMKSINKEDIWYIFELYHLDFMYNTKKIFNNNKDMSVCVSCCICS